MQQDQALFLLNLTLPTLKSELQMTKNVIAAIPLDKGGYRPDPVSKTALELAWHIVTTERRFFSAIAAGEFDLTPMPPPDSIRNSADLVAWYAESCQTAIAQMEMLTGDQLVKVMDFRGIFQFPAVVYMQFALAHSGHHRGQLSMYLRPMGAKVPSIYGESYDSAEARKAAQP